MRFGGLRRRSMTVSFAAVRGDITAIIGPNGAGKTTMFNCITGFYRPSEGASRLHPPMARRRARALAGPPHRTRARVARTFQNIRLFAGMTALENLLVAQHNALMRASGFGIGAMLGLSGYRRPSSARDRARAATGSKRPA